MKCLKCEVDYTTKEFEGTFQTKLCKRCLGVAPEGYKPYLKKTRNVPSKYRKHDKIHIESISKFKRNIRNGKTCSICGEVSENLVVDHDHKSGIIRGGLCYRCNLGLGMFKDCESVLQNAIEYLRCPPLYHHKVPYTP